MTIKNITEVIEDILQVSGKSEKITELCEELKKREPEYKKFDKYELLGLVHTDLSTDGKFVFISER